MTGQKHHPGPNVMVLLESPVSKPANLEPKTPGQQADLGLYEPPIGIEPMTYSLRAKTKPSIAVRGDAAPLEGGPNDADSSDRIRVAVSKLLATSWSYPSAELIHDLRRDELEMVEVMQVEHLEIDPAGTHL